MAGQSTSDAYTPAEIARKAEQVGIAKASLSFRNIAMLAILAGAFVALGGIAYLTVTTDVQGGYGVTQLLGGLIFNMGLLLCSVAGSELFTGNSLLIIPFMTRKISLKQMVRNWVLVYLFNMVGALIVAFLIYRAQHWTGGGNLVGARVLTVAASKASYSPEVIFFRGLFANLLVCLAVWMGYAGRTVTDKVMAYILPITGFVASGFEHSVANMFFIPYGMMVKAHSAVTAMPGVPVEKLHYLNMAGFAKNLTWSTLGNLAGGAICVGLAYWFIYLKQAQQPSEHKQTPAA